jgi:hypothetical protein|tara:strand:- start:441 stop:830 length:390 start_codon:yes stop_codon:yes gene_type:complete
MGRYYHGDIEGKFMFGVQSSTDADFFGVEGEATHLSYGFNAEDLPKVEEGIKECEGVLGEYLEHIDKFFKENDSFSSERLAKYLTELLGKNVTEENTRFNLEWYARLELGREIRDCIKENDYCGFEAEL